MRIAVNHVNKSYGSFAALKGVSFEIHAGRLIGLLGPSGGGKTTLLRILAGLETVDSGDVYFNDAKVNDLPPQKRGIGFVFQSYALFKHMTVYDNIAFGLTLQHKKKSAEINKRVSELIELTGLSGLEKRYPNQLSGGQRQRVAFARALAPKPQLLLLDEPFAAIDAKVRKELRTWLRDMISKVGVTTIFVTHDQEEAVEVADEIIVINQGRLEQKGAPIDIYRQPHTPFVASFIGDSMGLEEPQLLKGFAGVHSDAKAIVRPEFVEIGRPGELTAPSAAEKGTVRSTFFRGSSWLIEAELRGQRLHAYRSLEQPQLQVGEEVDILIHRLYCSSRGLTRIEENRLRDDPMPVHI
jgi:sulfate/thiosulfate transport system ATP-binding protein